MREQLGQVFVKFHVMGDDRTDRCRHGLGHIALGEAGFELFLRRIRLHEHDARRGAIGAGRTHAHQIKQCVQGVVRYRLVLPVIIGTRIVKQ